ncbi:non-ribosomal peptide synthetase [Phaeobacter inhibens]|uniref:non-ribosomal peptide synthetase n=1 Tax=Phaeobacter inhibens TaxID=221822 RepID=UPI000C9C55DD|nr:non-ribosomal peptide synthetase [Phaeobacter inhibens]AUQ56808.1 putative nonribosomal peptide synthetase [Phaeobacter inhibens]AUQ80825.1 putative nonribosomal peptide synthetase [Phaeobacter inhibens]AUR17984.1 putative nonribosomal peptide synthetase [Phaeobacter inhibens]
MSDLSQAQPQAQSQSEIRAAMKAPFGAGTGHPAEGSGERNQGHSSGQEIALTPMQQGLLYESAAAGRPWVNLEQIVVHLDAEAPDPRALRVAWQQVCARHPVLRSAVLWQGRPLPVLQVAGVDAAADQVRVETQDWQGLEAEDQAARLEQFLTEDRNRGCALEQAVSWRVMLARLGPNRSVMVWTIHHVLVDGRSMAVVLEDVFAALIGGDLPAATAPVTGFDAFSPAVAQVSEQPASQAFFRAHLEGFDTPNQIARLTGPDDRPVVAAPDDADHGRKQILRRQLPAELRRALVQRAAQVTVADETLPETSGAQGAGAATLANMIHAAWGLLVARWSGREMAVFGVTRSGRYLLEGCGRTVGCLINTVPLHLHLSGSTTVDGLLAGLRRDAVALRPHEQASLADMRRWCGLPGSVPLFDTMVMFERDSLNMRMRSLGVEKDSPWQHRRVELREEGAMPLTLAVYGDAQPLVMLEYDPEVLPASQVERMLDHLCQLLQSLATAPADMALRDLGMLPEAEATQLLQQGRPEPALAQMLAREMAAAPPCMATRLEATAARMPDAPALQMAPEGAVLSHADLQARADLLAVVLQAQGAAAGDIIAICLPRSPEFIIAMLAVLKVGAAFLPVDPTYPAAVIAHMLQDSGTRLGIGGPDYGTVSGPDTGSNKGKSVHRHDAALTPEGLVWVAPDAKLAPSEKPTPPTRPAPDPGRLAYVIYTSGSTGKPKGVRVPMRALLAHASAITAAFDLQSHDRMLQFASLSFDVAIEEVLPSLLAGACVVLRTPDMIGAPGLFLDRVAALELTVLNLPTAFWHVLCDVMADSGRSLPPSVRLVIVGGEQVSPQALARWQQLVPGVRWLNGYGPTETTITCTLHDPGLDRGHPVNANEDVPIGRPTAHARAYVLAADGSLAPDGVAGDLWIGGPAVSDGYIGRPEETARVFRPDPFAPQNTGGGHQASCPAARIYRTGDRAAWRGDGTLAFLGRQDRQVKLRGFRIDLRHVEQVLERAHPEVQALVAVHGKDGPAAQLCCWVRGTRDAGENGAVDAAGDTRPDLAALQQIVQRDLPAHMRPALVPVAEFPRTAGGKIDMAALPAPAAASSSLRLRRNGGAAIDTTAPPSPLAEQLMAMMADVLGQPDLGVDDSFYDRGGHSLLAMRLIGRIEAELGQRLSLAALHLTPSPRALAAALTEGAEGGDSPETPEGHTLPDHLVIIQDGTARAPLFGVHVLGRNEEFYRPLAAALGPDQPVYGLSIGLLDSRTPTGVRATAKLYLEEIQTHYPSGVVHLAAVSLGSYFAFELARQLLEAGRELGVLALFDAEGPAGRRRVQGRARLGAHLGLLRRMGPAYLGHVARHRIETLRNSFERRRLEWTGGGGSLSIEALIAANQQSVERYTPDPLATPLTVFRAGDDLFDSPEALTQGLGWAPVAAAGFELIEVPGSHLSILQEPNVQDMARHMTRIMQRSDPQ